MGSGRGKKRKLPEEIAQATTTSSIVDLDEIEDGKQSAPPLREQSQLSIRHAFSNIGTGRSVPQSSVDQRLIECFIDNMLPLSLIDSPSFVNLLQTLNNRTTVMSRRTLCRRIAIDHEKLEQHLIR